MRPRTRVALRFLVIDRARLPGASAAPRPILLLSRVSRGACPCRRVPVTVWRSLRQTGCCSVGPAIGCPRWDEGSPASRPLGGRWTDTRQGRAGQKVGRLNSGRTPEPAESAARLGLAACPPVPPSPQLCPHPGRRPAVSRRRRTQAEAPGWGEPISPFAPAVPLSRLCLPSVPLLPSPWSPLPSSHCPPLELPVPLGSWLKAM